MNSSRNAIRQVFETRGTCCRLCRTILLLIHGFVRWCVENAKQSWYRAHMGTPKRTAQISRTQTQARLHRYMRTPVQCTIFTRCVRRLVRAHTVQTQAAPCGRLCRTHSTIPSHRVNVSYVRIRTRATYHTKHKGNIAAKKSINVGLWLRSVSIQVERNERNGVF